MPVVGVTILLLTSDFSVVTTFFRFGTIVSDLARLLSMDKVCMLAVVTKCAPSDFPLFIIEKDVMNI
ncbi:hypothetical protein HAX54_001203, partial [Datura stramonium]|nr:hypothetical protein [Datura stramonium]